MNQIFPLQLMLSHGVGDTLVRRFAEIALRDNIDDLQKLSTRHLCHMLGIRSELADKIISVHQEATTLSQQLNKSGISWVSLGEQEYPNKLQVILGNDAPALLFFRGNLELCQMHSVGFCGSRSASEKGLVITEKCCQQLVEQDVVVVSGYAHGVDIVSHVKALQEGGNTIIVLAEGICRFREKQKIHGLLHPWNHLVISQFPPRLPWTGYNAMRRNSTIISLSDAMILVESGTKGGTYAAGIESLRRRIPLFVIDFASPPGVSAEANPEFINRGGLPIRGTPTGKPNLKHVLNAVNNSVVGQFQKKN